MTAALLAMLAITFSMGSAGALVMKEVDAFNRPDSASGVFGTLPAGSTVELLATTGSGWLGFDPGVAQAANVGSFRLRWLPPDAPVMRSSRDTLPVVWGPSAGVSYAIVYEPTPLLVGPDSTASPVDTLPAGSAAALIGRLSGWYLVDPSEGPQGEGGAGWMPGAPVSVSGPLDSVPVVPPDHYGVYMP